MINFFNHENQVESESAMHALCLRRLVIAGLLVVTTIVMSAYPHRTTAAVQMRALLRDGPSYGGYAALTVGKDGNIWAAQQSGNTIARITPQGQTTNFPIPTSGAGPYDLTSGRDGNIWFTEYTTGNIGRITPAGKMTEYPLAGDPRDSSYLHPSGITMGPDGNIWFVEGGFEISTISYDGQITSFKTSLPPDGRLDRITQGTDNALWVTETGGNHIGRFTLAGKMTWYAIPGAGYLDPAGIVAGPDGNIWFTLSATHKVGRLTPAGKITEFPLPSGKYVFPNQICVGSDGNLWFAVSGVTLKAVGRITTQGKLTLIPLASNDGSTAIVSSPDGAIYLADHYSLVLERVAVSGQLSTVTSAKADLGGVTVGQDGVVYVANDVDGTIMEIDPKLGVRNAHTFPPVVRPQGMTLGPDGAVWLTDPGSNAVGQFGGPQGVWNQFLLPTKDAQPANITPGPDGNLWFTETKVHQIGRISPTGTITEFPLPATVRPIGITTGADGNLWFTDAGANSIGRITPAGVVSTFAIKTPDAYPNGITKGPDGNVWFTELHTGKIGEISPTGVITETVLSITTPVPVPFGIVTGGDGAVYVTDETGHLFRISLHGQITERTLNSGSIPTYITADTKNNIWFTLAKPDIVMHLAIGASFNASKMSAILAT